jgi:uncharacterized protein with FMN-binding domain
MNLPVATYVVPVTEARILRATKECMMSPFRTAAALAGLSFTAFALAGCSGTATADGSGSTGPSSASGGSASGPFKDGTYTALGKYTSPGGPSAVDVKVTLKSDAVTAIKVTPKAENPTAQGYEGKFASGVGTKVIGKKLSELNVTKVSGSSLTSQGFDRAIEAIAKQASA